MGRKLFTIFLYTQKRLGKTPNRRKKKRIPDRTINKKQHVPRKGLQRNVSTATFSLSNHYECLPQYIFSVFKILLYCFVFPTLLSTLLFFPPFFFFSSSLHGVILFQHRHKFVAPDDIPSAAELHDRYDQHHDNQHPSGNRAANNRSRVVGRRR